LSEQFGDLAEFIAGEVDGVGPPPDSMMLPSSFQELEADDVRGRAIDTIVPTRSLGCDLRSRHAQEEKTSW
jgi:hypothetical protein